MPLLDYITPESLALDNTRFPEFRPAQLEAIEKIAYSDKRFVVLGLMTGTGKSLIAAAAALFTNRRTVILTHTKGLQQQYVDDLSSSGLVDIRGRANYECPHADNCRDGMEIGCTMRGICTYNIQKAKVINSQLVISNYAYWFAVNALGSGLNGLDIDEDTGQITGGVDMLVLDEGHYAPTALSDFLGFTIFDKDIERYSDPLGDNVDEWANLGRDIVEELKAELRTLRMELSHFKNDPGKRKKLLTMIRHTKSTCEKMYKLSNASSQDWVCELKENTRFGRQWKFDIIWPGLYAEKHLFCGVPKVVIMSATIRPKTMALLGVGKDEFEFFEWDRVFPAQRCPVYFCPPQVEGKQLRITRNSTQEQLLEWVRHIDAMIESRLDRRILVLTTSYKYQQFLKENSKHRHLMVGNTDDPDSDSAAEVFEQFITTKPPVILCSPSFGTGWDFKDDRAELLIISKVPLRIPGSASKLMQARLDRDKDYGAYETMQDLVQSAGRLQRSETDRGEIVITDGSASWFLPRYKHLAPSRFVSSIRTVRKLPKAPPRLLDENLQ